MDKRKPLPINPELKEYAVKMRKNMTDEEKKVWYQILKGHVPKFHRQRVIGNYIVDFFCPKLKLVIEIDGYQHFYEENKEYDNKRTEYLESLGPAMHVGDAVAYEYNTLVVGLKDLE